MKYLTSLLITSKFILTVLPIDAQDIQMTSGNKTKTINAGTFIEVELATPYQQPCKECPLYMVAGKLVSYDDGKLNLLIQRSREPIVEEKKQTGVLIKKFKQEDMHVLSVPREEVLSITQRGKKKFKESTAGQAIGRLIFVLGLANMISSPVAAVEDGETGKLLLSLGAIEVLTGMVVNAVFDQKTYFTSENSSLKDRRNKIWVIN